MIGFGVLVLVLKDRVGWVVGIEKLLKVKEMGGFFLGKGGFDLVG